MIKASALLATVASISITAAVQAQPDARELLKAADQATKEVEAVSYQVQIHGIGSYTTRVPNYKAHLLVVKDLDNQDFPALLAAKGEMWAPASTDRKSFQIAFDGENAYSLNETDKTLTKAPAGDGGLDLIGPARTTFILEYAHPTPFQDEIDAESATLEGQALVGETLCNVIFVSYGAEFGGAKARWYFGSEDNLPRQVERIGEIEGQFGATVFTLTDLKLNPEYTPADFTIAAPSGYEVKTYERPAPQQPPALLEVGSKAPNWTLEDAAGKAHSLNDYRGKVVLMDFWATWCGPCKAAMPSIQKIHERFADKGLVVLGMNCWESGDPAKYMDEKGYTYGLMVGADDVAEAYGVSGIPTFYLIGKDGEIVHVEVGFSGQTDNLAEMIQTQLDKGGA